MCRVWLAFALMFWHMRLHHPACSPVMLFAHTDTQVKQVLHSPEEPASGGIVLISLQLKGNQAPQALGNSCAQPFGVSLQQQDWQTCPVGPANAANTRN